MGEGDSEGRESKRRRTARACVNCRTRKIRCDGAYPSCGPCVQLEYECSYSVGGPSAVNVSVTREYLTSLEERIVKLEAHAQRHDGFEARDLKQPILASPSDSPNSNEDDGTRVKHLGPTPGDSSSGEDRVSNVPALGSGDAPPPQGSPTRVDAMGSLRFDGPLKGVPGESYHAEMSSGVSLVLKAFFMGPRPLLAPSFEAPSTRAPSEAPETNPIKLGIIDSASLPSKEEAMVMFDEWRNIGRLYPWAHEVSMRASYLHFLDNPDSSVPFFSFSTVATQLALHFSMFAMASRISSSTKDRWFYDKATLLLGPGPPKQFDFLYIQAQLIRALHSQSGEDPSECWHIAGLAVRSAYGMGIHREWTRPGASYLEREMRIRTWLGCVTIDRLMTVTLDRPSAISSSTVHYPLASPLPDEPPTLTDFFNNSISLYRVFADIAGSEISTFSLLHEQQASIGPAAITLIASLEDRLAALTPPEHLKVLGELGARHWTQTEAVVLALRTNAVRLLVHRPMLHEAIQAAGRDRESSPWSTAVGLSISIIILTSVSSIDLLLASEGKDNLSAPWWRLFYALNSFMALSSAMTLDLSMWSHLISTSRASMHGSLFVVRGLIERLAHPPASSSRRGLASAARSLPIVDRILSVPALAEYALPTNYGGGPDAMLPQSLCPSPIDLSAAPDINWDEMIRGLDMGGGGFNFSFPGYDAWEGGVYGNEFNGL